MADPPADGPRLRLQLLAQYGIGEGRREQHAVSGDEPSGFGQPAMRRDEILRRDAVAVEKDAVIPAAGENGAVADFRGAKAAVPLPDVAERNPKTPAPAFHDGRGRGVRAVVRDHNLETAIGLARQSPQNRVERVLPIVRRDNDGDEIGHVGTTPVFVLHEARRCDSVRRGRAQQRGTMQKISAYILAFNEAEKVADAVSSVLWADEIIVT